MDVYRFRVLLGASLQALMLSVIPFLLHHAGLAESTTWATSSFLVCVLFVVIGAADLRFLGGIRDQIPRSDRVLGVAIARGFVCVFVIQVANVFGTFTAGAFAAYLSALIYYLGMSSLMFIRLLAGVGLERGHENEVSTRGCPARTGADARIEESGARGEVCLAIRPYGRYSSVRFGAMS